MDKLAKESMTNFPSNGEGYTCKHCNSFIPVQVVSFLDQEKIVQPACQCEADILREQQLQREQLVKEKETRRLFSISELGERFADSTFETFQAREGSQSAYQVVKKYASEFERWNGDSLGLWGEPGNGKTHLAYAVMNELNNAGKVVVLQSMPELLKRIKSTFNNNSRDNEQQIMKALTTCDLLIIDDIGAEKLTDWVEETIFTVVDGRYRRNKPILYTSNLKPSELADKLGRRSYDRLVEMCLTVENKATSYRRERATDRIKKFRAEVESWLM